MNREVVGSTGHAWQGQRKPLPFLGTSSDVKDSRLTMFSMAALTLQIKVFWVYAGWFFFFFFKYAIFIENVSLPS